MNLGPQDEKKVRAIIRYSFEDASGFDGLTTEEKKIIENKETYERIIFWAKGR